MSTPTGIQLNEALLPFMNWLTAQSDEAVVRFCWDILAFRPRPYGSYQEFPISWLRKSGRLRGAISQKYMECAITLADDAEAMYWWPADRWRVIRWERDSLPYIELFSHSSYLIRTSAAKALGELFWGCSHEQNPATAPPLREIIARMQIEEQRSPGVARPFLDGAHWTCGELLTLAADFDFRGWMLETLVVSSREIPVPHLQTLEFFAMEYFAGDTEAVQEMRRMGRHELAKLTLEEEASLRDSLPL